MNTYGRDGWEGDLPLAPAKTTATYQANGLDERVIVPGLKAAIVAVASGLLSGLLIGAFHIPLPVWYAIPIVTLIVFLIVFWGSSDRGQWLIERISGADLNGDGYIGAPVVQNVPQLPPEKVIVELVQNKGMIGERGDDIDLPYPDKLPMFAREVLAGRSYSQTAMVGTGRLFQRHEYDALVNALIAGGLARWKNPEAHNAGWVLTSSGKAVLKHFSPPPQDEDTD